MAKRHSNNRLLVRAAEYIRMSSGKQERSPEQQRSEIAKLAFLDIRRAFNPDGSLKQINELDPETAAAVAGIEHESFLIILAIVWYDSEFRRL